MNKSFHFIESENDSAEINMSPLIDMVFILLIFFIITTNFNRQTGVDVTKPNAQSAVSQGNKVLLIGITREGTIHVYGRQLNLDRLSRLIEREVKERPEVSIVIVSDKHAEIGKAVEVMDRCSMAGAKKVSIAADKE